MPPQKITTDSTIGDALISAMHYTGYPPSYEHTVIPVGLAQLELLKLEGLKPDSTVLEMGAGSLVGAKPIIEFLNPKKYIGIEPNSQLVASAILGLELGELFYEKKPTFIHTDDFDASHVIGKNVIDFVISHSIVSHMAHKQFAMMLKNLKPILKHSAVLIFSFRMAEEDSNNDTWQYPGASKFKYDTLAEICFDNNYTMCIRSSFKKIMMEAAPNHYHDWMVLVNLIYY